jgi:TRAP-type C4-dicarboxylate transport system permease small subunit
VKKAQHDTDLQADPSAEPKTDFHNIAPAGFHNIAPAGFHNSYPEGPRKFVRILVDIIEIYIPAVAFIGLFCTFVLSVFFRYFLTPLIWDQEFTLTAFIWIICLGASYAQRDDSHIRFSMIYDMLPDRMKRGFRITGNSMIIFALILSFGPSFKWIVSMEFHRTNIFKIPYSIIYAPYILLLLSLTARYAASIIRDIQSFRTGTPGTTGTPGLTGTSKKRGKLK